ncbi:MAG TPA: 2-oxoglutarate dehydrogenase E1 component [Bacteroidota bacterium]|jgi:2-oxoglutarate dehydrogenase E1 component|nr:2-oxoglutarate dehydrogenase E1 component [Bacteroidota bacterium]
MQLQKTAEISEEEIFNRFRRWGYLQARIDPFTMFEPREVPELAIQGESADLARKYYCESIGAEFMHIPDDEKRRWIQERMETTYEPAHQHEILERLIRADVLEQILHARYPGTKRFSLEGVDAVIPLLDEILERAMENGAVESVMGMSHRGRLNVMVQVIGKKPSEIFAGFEDVDPRSILGGGDVKYHMGATGEYVGREGKKMTVRLSSNPSHLEAVDPVVLGRARAKQTRAGESGTREILPILIHGDAAFAGQGILAESLNLTSVEGFSVGGTIHILANNLLGFTAKPSETNSTIFATDVAKRLPIPIFHVNANDPDAVVRAGIMALEYRYQFASSVIIDVIGYRRHGHSEVDDPTITQPILYKKIKEIPPVWKLYAEQLDATPEEILEHARKEYDSAKDEASALKSIPRLSARPEYWDPYDGGPYRKSYEVETSATLDELKTVGSALTGAPQDFHVHPKVQRLLDQRRKMANGDAPVDFGMAEQLAFGTLVKQGVPVRLSGQDSKRGTFSQRHASLIDVENESEYIPLQHIATGQGWFEVYNSILSEAAVMGFEYGFSRDYPEALILWEAQFGDFANGAQIIIDQFIAASEDKWDLLSGLVLLLPHGYEGQGPEHSSARIERYLQLAAEDNMQVCQPSTAAQYFHLLRRQALRKWKKALIVITPKSMLRLADAASPIQDFATQRFQPVLPDLSVPNPERILICTGKVGRELRAERAKRNDTSTAIVFLEQLYPFPKEELTAILEDYAEAREIIWVQEEPANMGALSYVYPRLKRLVGTRPLRSIKRSASAGTATGSAKAHELEQKAIMALAFRKS